MEEQINIPLSIKVKREDDFGCWQCADNCPFHMCVERYYDKIKCTLFNKEISGSTKKKQFFICKECEHVIYQSRKESEQ